MPHTCVLLMSRVTHPPCGIPFSDESSLTRKPIVARPVTTFWSYDLRRSELFCTAKGCPVRWLGQRINELVFIASLHARVLLGSRLLCKVLSNPSQRPNYKVVVKLCRTLSTFPINSYCH